MTYIIAEAGVNTMKFKIAKKLIKAAKNNGADALNQYLIQKFSKKCCKGIIKKMTMETKLNMKC